MPHARSRTSKEITLHKYVVEMLMCTPVKHVWIVPQLSIRINYNGTWSILIQWLIGLW